MIRHRPAPTEGDRGAVGWSCVAPGLPGGSTGRLTEAPGLPGGSTGRLTEAPGLPGGFAGRLTEAPGLPGGSARRLTKASSFSGGSSARLRSAILPVIWAIPLPGAATGTAKTALPRHPILPPFLMKRQDYYPSAVEEQLLWLSNFASVLPAHAAVLHITAAALADAIADAAWVAYILDPWRAAVRSFSKSATAAMEAVRSGAGVGDGVLPVFVVPPLEDAAPRPGGVALPSGEGVLGRKTALSAPKTAPEGQNRILAALRCPAGRPTAHPDVRTACGLRLRSFHQPPRSTRWHPAGWFSSRRAVASVLRASTSPHDAGRLLIRKKSAARDARRSGDRKAGINTHVAERQDAVRPRCVLRFWMPPAQGVFCAFGRRRRQGN